MSQFTSVLHSHKRKRKQKFDEMLKEGYLYGEVLHFNNEKGFGVAVDDDGNRFILRYFNMLRVTYKILSKGQKVHFKPGLYKGSLTAEDVAVVTF